MQISHYSRQFWFARWFWWSRSVERRWWCCQGILVPQRFNFVRFNWTTRFCSLRIKRCDTYTLGSVKCAAIVSGRLLSFLSLCCDLAFHILARTVICYIENLKLVRGMLDLFVISCSFLILWYYVGGSPGQRGLNLVKYASGRTVNVGAKNSISVLPWVWKFIF